MATFFRFAKVLGFLDLKNVEVIEKMMRARPSDLFKVQSLIIRREIIGNRYSN